MNRVLIRKSDGVPVEYQSGSAPLGTLIKNAINAGLDPRDYEEKYISKEEYDALFKEKVLDPKKQEKENKKNQAKSRILAKLKITEEDLNDLREVL